MRKIILSFFAFVCAVLPVRANSTLPEVAIPTVDEAVFGEWIGNFQTATNLAISTSTPLVMVWSGNGCDYCNTLKPALLTQDFVTWRKASGLVFCAMEDDDTSLPFAKRIPYNGVNYGRQPSHWPYVCLFWVKADGSVVAQNFTTEQKTADTSVYPAVVATMTNAVETLFADFFTTGDGAFVVGDTEGDRLEAEPSTDAVWVPLMRTANAAGKAATNRVTYATQDGVATRTVAWAKGEVKRYAQVDLTAVDRTAGALTLTLTGADGAEIGTNALHFVAAQANSVRNPHWVGEKTVDTLGFADWTLDYDTAKAKVAAGKADYLLVFYSGVLWCPYCKGIEESLMASDEWKAWLEKNRVQVCLFDQDLSPTDTYAGGAGLLTYQAGEEHYNAVGSRALVSGAGYLSRHGLKDDDAEVVAVHERSITNSWTNWKAPNSTAVRLSTPAVLLIGKNDQVLGRLNAWRDRNGVFGTDAKYYDTDENLARLDALLKLGSRADESDDYAATSTLAYAAGTETNLTLQVNSAARYLRLGNLATGTLTVTADTNLVKLAVTEGGTTLASGMGSVTLKLNRSRAAATDLMLGVSVPSYTDTSATGNALFGAGNTLDVTLTSAIEPAVIADTVTFNRYFAGTNVVEQVLADDGLTRVTVTKTSGTLPAGVTLKYDAARGAVVLVGTPSRVQTTTFTYRVTCYYGTDAETGEEAEVTVTVADPHERNPYVNAALSRTLPLFVETDGTNLLAGTLTVSATANNRLSARFTGSTGRALAFSGAWGALDEDDTASAHLALRAAAATLDLTLDAEGRLAATLAGLDARVSAYTELAGEAPAPMDCTAYAGAYTVSLPLAAAEPAGLMTGAGYLMLTMNTASAIRAGRMTVAGVLPNGTAVSAAATLVADPTAEGYALLPILRTGGTDRLALTLRLQANAAALYRDPETVRTVLARPGTVQRWEHAETRWSQTANLDVWGGYFPKYVTLGTWFDTFGFTPALTLSLESAGLAAGTRYGALTAEQAGGLLTTNRLGNLVFTERTGTVSAAYNRANGLVSGTAKLVFESGRTVSATWRGVVTPGWTSCGCGDDLTVRPFGYGAAFFTDTVEGVLLKRSLPVTLEIAE